MLMTLLYFFIALLLLVTVHEYGHFLVARLCGVKVLRFSFGFGKVLARWHDKKGTEYVFSAVPLGGYVKMLDESEGPVAEHEQHLAFNNKSVWARIAIVLAGPMFNFLFAFIALWLVLVIGIKSLAPMIEHVIPGSIAYQAGLQADSEITQLNDKKITSWRDFQYAFMPLIGSHETIRLKVKSLNDNQQSNIMLPLENLSLAPDKPDLLQSIGIVPFIPKVPPIIGDVMEGSPAQQAGLQKGDKVETLNGKPLVDWLNIVEFVKSNPNKPMSLTVLRTGQRINTVINIGSKEQNGQTVGFIGVYSQKVEWPKQWLRIDRQGPIDALNTAFKQTIHLTGATFSLIGRFITGQLGLHSISGPVGIAQGAGESARSGFVYYLSFLALISISLGVLNLLPIPMLDGGHLLYYALEVVRRKPLSEGVRSVGLYMGLVFLVALMFLALSNDIARLTS